MRRTAAFIITLLLCLGITVSAATSVPTDTTAGGTDTTATDTTTTVPTTTTTKPTDKRVESVQYATETLPRGAVMHGKAEWEVGRNEGKALHFNGTDTYIEIDIAKLSSPFTLSMWVNWQAIPGNLEALDQRLFSFVKKNTENGISLSPWVKREGDNNESINGIAVLGACYDKQWIRKDLYYPSSEAISDMLPVGMWHAVAMTVEGDTVTVYIDGLQWKRQTLPFAFEDLKADTLLIGAANGGVCLFSGLMQDVQLYENALTPTQVLRISKDIDPFDATFTDTPAMYLPVPLQETVLLQQSYRIMTVLENDKTGAEMVADPGGAFWETPVLSGGQSVTCTLIVENKSKQVMNAALEAIVLPQQGTPEWLYLSEILVTVNDGEQTLFSGPYTDITAEKLNIRATQMPYGYQHTYTVTLSRPFTAQTAYAAYTVNWQFGCDAYPITDSALPAQQPLTWLIVLLSVSVIAVAFCIYWAITKTPARCVDGIIKRVARLRRTPQVQPAVEKTADEAEALSADTEDLPAEDTPSQEETE